MSLDPIKTFKSLKDSYAEFIDAQFTFRNAKINSEAKKAISNECELLKGPYIEAHMPYAGENTLEELVKTGLLNGGIKNAFTDKEYSVYKRYNHQEKAIRKVNNGKSIIVASGTGSGKTECFFIPIINELLNEYDANTLCPGVRALLIYPMNALANDQMDRLRDSLKNLPQITFGRYIGETQQGNYSNIPQGRQRATESFINDNGKEPLPNELITRAEIEATPPHILVTNYAMLEFMLLRASSQKIFKGAYSKHFKFLVLDEAHTYKGAHGTEVAMLIRRLKEAIFGRIDNCLTCIGTSATLGGGDDEKNKVAEFAHDLFNEEFSTDSIITSDRLQLKKVDGPVKELSFYSKLYEQYKDYSGADKSDKLYEILHNDGLIYAIRKHVLKDILTIDELSDILSKELNIKNKDLSLIITQMIELCSETISPEDGNPLINAKYHVFARTLEGGFISFKDGAKVFTERRKEYEGYRVYELLNCMKCGQEYITGKIETINEDEYLLPAEDDGNDLFMLSSIDNQLAVDEDDSLEDLEFDKNHSEYLMCPKCGKLFPSGVTQNITCCGHEYNDFIKMTKVSSRGQKTNCYKCGKSNKGTIRKLTTSEDSATEMLTRKLYQLLPEEKVKKQEKNESINSMWGVNEVVENDIISDLGRKLLVFSDNRQDAAKFAIFIQDRYNDWVWKNIITNVINNMSEDEISYNRLVERCLKLADKHNLFYDMTSFEEKENFTKTQVMKEVIELDSRMSLNRLGLINIKINLLDKISDGIVSNFCDKYNLSKDEFLNLVYFIFDSLRRQGCVEFPEGISQTDDTFEPKNRFYWFKSVGGTTDKDSQIYGLIPSAGKTNNRFSFIKNVFLHKGYSDSDSMDKTLAFLNDFIGALPSYFIETLPVICSNEKHYYKLKLNNIVFTKSEKQLYVCDKCGETSTINLHGICSKTNCDGKLIEIHSNEDRGDYYRKSFTDIKLIPMHAKEHTAQLSSIEASKLQKMFKEGKLHLLSCSTTFEMGVDIGSLEAVVLRNVPPETANYIQRAGRAGRRGSSAAFILTFAKRRSHDLSYYSNPVRMIDGIIQAPYVELNNAYLVRRHIHSIIFSYMCRNGFDMGKAEDFLENENHERINILLYKLLKDRPQELYDSISIVVPDSLKSELGIDSNWSFIKKLVDNENPDNKEACFDNAVQQLSEKIRELSNEQEEYSKSKTKEDYFKAGKLAQLITNYKSKDYITFLAEKNVIPRYGFPVYTVPLVINSDSTEKSNIELSRDLRMAITEYAPGAQVVASGKYWKPYALVVQNNKTWSAYDFAICEHCKKIFFYYTALGVEKIARQEECCHDKLRYSQMIIPEFGFVTKRSDKESKKIKQEVHYSSESFFNGFEDNTQLQEQDIIINDKNIHLIYSPRGEMFVVNRGYFASKTRELGHYFKVCETCGYVQTNLIGEKEQEKGHLTADGYKCHGKLHNCYLGHHFTSDALVIQLPVSKELDLIEYESILYAIIEGASRKMEIDRREISGSIWRNGQTNGINITLFDTVPNGAGHVKRMVSEIKEILEEALVKVSGQCGCGEETCCYGCLRNYDNQQYHDSMSRGRAKKYFEWLLKNK